MAMHKEPGPIRAAVIGLGRAGWILHAVPMHKNPNYRVAVCVDPVAERRAEAETQLGAKTYATYEEFLANPGDVELVVIATANTMHAPMTTRALRAGFHVLVEKPMAVSREEGLTLLAEAQRAKRVLTVHQSWRCQPEFRQVQAILRSGLLGRVFQIKLHFTRYARRNDWQTLRQYGGGMLNNTGAHTLDMALRLLEAPVQDVWGDLQSIVTSGDTEDHVHVLVRGTNGRVVEVEASDAVAAPQHRFAVMGANGGAWPDGDDFLVRYLDPSQLTPLSADPSLAVPNRIYGVPNDKLPWQEKRFPRKAREAELDFHQDLFASIRQGQELLVKPEEVCEAIRVMELARRGTAFG
jgi:predicted dehydrogenase